MHDLHRGHREHKRRGKFGLAEARRQTEDCAAESTLEVSMLHFSAGEKWLPNILTLKRLEKEWLAVKAVIRDVVAHG